MVTKEQAMAARYRQEFWHVPTGARVRVNGQCKTWKRDPERFRLPVKHGLRQCLYITEINANEFTSEKP